MNKKTMKTVYQKLWTGFWQILLRKIIKWLLLWIAAVVTALPYSNQRSLLLDRLIDLLEN